MEKDKAKVDFRHMMEEELRTKAYACVDTAHDLEVWDTERVLWDEVHHALIKLAEHYERHGYKIWKH